ncbi:MAG TPA: FtsX-like permease family protein, partial [Vicinamibacterales bacterium]
AVGLQADLVRDIRSSLYLLWGGALFVLLIGCVNVASLVLVRSRVRLKEFATRLALGANQWHLIRQLTTEYVLLTMVAALGGLGIGSSTLRVLRALNLELPRFAEIQIDGMVIVSTLLVAAAVGVLLGAIPVVGGLTVNLTTSLNSEGRGGSIGRGARAQGRALVVTQVAVAFVLLICAGLLLASFRRVLAVDPGFNPDAVLTASVNLPGSRYPDDASVRRFTDDALRAIRSTAGVVAAGTTTSIPFGDNFAESGLLAEGYHMRTSESLIAPYEVWASPGFFETMQMRLVQGRLFNDHDTADAPSVVIIDEKLAHRFWPDANPVGHRMYEPSDNPDPTAITARTVWHTVIGVVKEVKLRGLVEGVGEVGAYYYPQAQRPPRSLTFAIRTATAHSSVASALRSEIATIDPELPVFDVQTMTDRTDRSLVSQRTAVLLATAFGFVALLLSAIGIYGMLAYLVTQRTKEIGIRMALGSSTSAVFRLVLREGVWLMVGGFVLGTSGAMAISHSLEHQLFGVHVSDPVVLLLAILPLALVGLIACVLPANRASRISPIVALSE